METRNCGCVEDSKDALKCVPWRNPRKKALQVRETLLRKALYTEFPDGRVQSYNELKKEMAGGSQSSA